MVLSHSMSTMASSTGPGAGRKVEVRSLIQFCLPALNFELIPKAEAEVESVPESMLAIV